MKKRIVLTVLVAGLTGCISTESQVKEAILKNPKIVFDVIEEHPEQFMEVVTRAAQKARESEMRKQMDDMKAQEDKDLKNPKQPKLDRRRRLSGTDNGKIVVVEYADFQCPACRMAFQSLKDFKDRHAGDVQFYYKNMPLDFHKMAHPSALYFEAIRMQDTAKALHFYEAVFEHQRELSDESFLKNMAKQVGADLGRLNKDIKSGAVQALIDEDMAEFQKFGFTGTPVIVLNGVALNGAQPLEELERVLKVTEAKR